MNNDAIVVLKFRDTLTTLLVLDIGTTAAVPKALAVTFPSPILSNIPLAQILAWSSPALDICAS